MSARAIWKGVIHLGATRVPVKLYSAVADRDVHFRLLHAKDKVPVKQAMVEPDSHRVVAHEDTQRAYVTDDHDWVVLTDNDLEALEPEPSRTIELLRFVPPGVIDHRWYVRSYYLGPDGSQAHYAALIDALQSAGKEGLARWTMRKREYIGALRLHAGYPVLVTLRHAGEVISIDELEAPRGRALSKKERGMAEQLIGMLQDDFDPDDYADTHRERIMDLIRKKRRGKTVKVQPMKRARPTQDVASALEASLQRERGS